VWCKESATRSTAEAWAFRSRGDSFAVQFEDPDFNRGAWASRSRSDSVAVRFVNTDVSRVTLATMRHGFSFADTKTDS